MRIRAFNFQWEKQPVSVHMPVEITVELESIDKLAEELNKAAGRIVLSCDYLVVPAKYLHYEKDKRSEKLIQKHDALANELADAIRDVFNVDADTDKDDELYTSVYNIIRDNIPESDARPSCYLEDGKCDHAF